MRYVPSLLIVVALSAWVNRPTLVQGSAPDKLVRLIAEAEDFTVETEGWRRLPFPENYYGATFAVTFLSRMACLAAPEQIEPGREAVAVQTVEVPYDGEFHVLARYEQPYNFSVEFAVEIEQAGKTVFRQMYGRLEDPKIWAFNGHQRVPMQRFDWGGTDNIVWQQAGPARLARGPATIRLIAGPQMDGQRPRAMAAQRHVDVICLTNDTAGMEAQKKTNYLEFDGWLVQDGDLFVRVTNPSDGPGPCIPVIAPFDGGQHSSYYVHVRDWPATKVLRSGRLIDPTGYMLAGPRSRSVRRSCWRRSSIRPDLFRRPTGKAARQYGRGGASHYDSPRGVSQARRGVRLGSDGAGPRFTEQQPLVSAGDLSRQGRGGVLEAGVRRSRRPRRLEAGARSDRPRRARLLFDRSRSRCPAT